MPGLHAVSFALTAYRGSLESMRRPEELLQDAMHLSDEERGSLALELLDSLSMPDSRDEDWWIAAIERRARRALRDEAAKDSTVEDAVARIESALKL
jgi:hypothetical protein